MEKNPKTYQEVKRRYEDAVNDYVELFCSHEHIDNDGYWVGDNIGGIMEICDHFLDFKDIKYAVDNETPIDSIFKWSDYVTDIAALGCTKTITYKDWCDDQPLPYSSDDLFKINAAHQRVVEAQEILQQCIQDVENGKD